MPLVVGEHIGQYRILSHLGAGGMGEVYLAQDEKLRRKVALKLLFADVTKSEDWVRRFEQEAYAASALNHPNIITIYEVGQVKDSHFISTEFIDGQTLRQRLREQSPTVAETLDITIQVATALVAAHAAGIIHRDIKPENVMLRSDGYVKVLDFGLAKFTETASQPSLPTDRQAETEHVLNTSPGVVMGTVSYMSPEQARGTRVDQRTDIFSFGVLLYEMLSGRLPFEGSTQTDIISSIISNKRQPPLARYVNEVSPELERIVAKALNKKKDDRYQTLKDMLIDLRTVKRQMELSEELDLSEPPTGHRSRRRAQPDAVTEQYSPFKTQPLVQSHPSSAEFIFNGLKRHRKAVLATTAVVTLLAIVGLGSYLFRRPPNSIAVLPFFIDNPDPRTEQAADRMVQGVINSFSQSSGLRVLSFNLVQRYKGKEVDPRTVGRELEVPSILFGRISKVQGDESSIIVNLELVNTSDGSQRWGMERTVKTLDYSLLVNEIVTQVSRTIGLSLTGDEQKRRDAEALYMKGRNAWNKRKTADIEQAVGFFKQALDLNPNYALAYAGLADSYNMLAAYGGKAPTEAFRQAREAATKSLELDSKLAEGHAALAYANFRGDWNWPEAEKEFRQAIALNDNYPWAHLWYGSLLASQGRFAESIKETQRAQQIEKTSPIITIQLGLVYYFQHQYREAVEECKKTMELDPTFFAAQRYLGLSYAQMGLHKEAIAEFEKAINASGDSPLMKAEYAGALALSGDTGKAQAQLNSLLETSKQKYVSAYHIAAVYVGLKDKDQAFTWLNKAFQDRADWMVNLKVDPRFESLHSDPRFAELLRQMKL
ncbi:MAG TPA: protein kinase [Pyrinomonadaceae bacterium]|nr:protein kinase [Pyrinomonadaceae bacterium]